MLKSFLAKCLVAGLTVCLFLTGAAIAQSDGPRLALVIGNAQYADPLATAANDAGLLAETLRGAGFDVTGAANLDQELLRRAFHDFLDKATQAGPNAIVFVYLAGRGLQYEGDNYFAPIDAGIARDSDIPLQALRLSDYAHALAALPLRARIIVVDAARANHFAQGGNIAGGLALVEADPGSLYAFNAAPGTIAPDEPGPYGAYAQALAELLRQGGVPIDIVFSQVRLRVNEATRGAVTPWNAANITPPLTLLQAPPNAPAAALARSYVTYQSRPVGSFPASEAYAAALERDTLEGYRDFLVAFPNDPLAARVRALLAARREALTWRRACAANSPPAYWSYMQRYPKGPHFYDARRRLIFLSAPPAPPPRFDVYDFGGLPPPPVVEYEVVDRPVIIFETGIYPPPPPPPVYFLPPPPVAFVNLAPPPPPPGPGFLPIPVPIPVPFGQHQGPQGTFHQPNFGQQGPVTPVSAPAGAPGGQQGGAGPGGGHPTVPAAAGVPPAAGAPNHALTQGGSLPPVPAGAHPGETLPAGGKAATSPAAPPGGAPGATPAATAAPNHALPQGAGLPPVPPAAHPAGTPPVGVKPAAPSAAPPAGASGTNPAATTAPGHALPQGAGLPAAAPDGHPAGTPMPGGKPTGARPTAPGANPTMTAPSHGQATPGSDGGTAAPPQPAAKTLVAPKAAAPAAVAAPHPGAPQAMTPPHPSAQATAPKPQMPSPHVEQMQAPRPQAPDKPHPAPQGKPAKPGEDPNHPQH